MAITTYAELLTRVKDYLERPDMSDAIVEDFIAMAETRFNRDIRHWKMEGRATTTATGYYTALPTDFNGMIAVTVGTGRPLMGVPLDKIADMESRNATSEDIPRYFAIVGEEMRVWPGFGDTAVDVNWSYYERIPALSDSQTTNWLLMESPQVYIYGALAHSAPYLAHDERLPVWEALATKEIRALNVHSDRAKHGATNLAMR